MESGRSKAVLLGILVVWAAVAAPTLARQWSRNSSLRVRLSAVPEAERARAVDNPAFDAAHRIADATPEDACVAVAAYAGPAAIDYYRARFDYLLYPRRVTVSARSSAGSGAGSGGCEYLAVFRDTPANLKAEPFAGEWDEDALAERTATLENVFRSELVSLYRRP